MHLYIFKKRLFILYAFDMTLEVEEFFFSKDEKENGHQAFPTHIYRSLLFPLKHD